MKMKIKIDDDEGKEKIIKVSYWSILKAYAFGWLIFVILIVLLSIIEAMIFA